MLTHFNRFSWRLRCFEGHQVLHSESQFTLSHALTHMLLRAHRHINAAQKELLSKCISLHLFIHINRFNSSLCLVQSPFIKSINPFGKSLRLSVHWIFLKIWKGSVRKMSNDLRMSSWLRHRGHFCLAVRDWGLILHHAAHSNSGQHAVTELKMRAKKATWESSSRFQDWANNKR